MPWSIIICSHNRAADLADNLPKVQALDYPLDRYEIIVIDNASSDGTAAVAAAAGVRCVREERLGLSHARNRGIAESRGELIGFIDDDAWPEPEWLQRLDDLFADPTVGCAGGQVVPEWGGNGKPSWLHERHVCLFTVVDYGDVTALRYSDYPAGTNIAFRRTVLESVGGFSSILGRTGQILLSGEETDLCLRVERAGYDIRYAPRAVVHHQIPASRLTKAWVKERAHWQGISAALLEQHYLSAPSRFVKLLKYVLFAVAGSLANIVFALLGQERDAFFCECQVALCQAYLKKTFGRDVL